MDKADVKTGSIVYLAIKRIDEHDHGEVLAVFSTRGGAMSFLNNKREGWPYVSPNHTSYLESCHCYICNYLCIEEVEVDYDTE